MTNAVKIQGPVSVLCIGKYQKWKHRYRTHSGKIAIGAPTKSDVRNDLDT